KPPAAAEWIVYKIKDSPLVAPLQYDPVVESGLDVTSVANLDTPQGVALLWFQQKQYWDVPIAANGPPSWPRLKLGYLASTKYTTKVPPTTVSDVRHDSSYSWLSFDVGTLGTPVEVKIPYFPNWHVSGAEGPYLVTPNLMVVVATSHQVRLSYGSTGVDTLGKAASVAGIAAVLGLNLRQAPPPASFSDDPFDDEDGDAPDEDGENPDGQDPDGGGFGQGWRSWGGFLPGRRSGAGVGPGGFGAGGSSGGRFGPGGGSSLFSPGDTGAGARRSGAGARSGPPVRPGPPGWAAPDGRAARPRTSGRNARAKASADAHDLRRPAVADRVGPDEDVRPAEGAPVADGAPAPDGAPVADRTPVPDGAPVADRASAPDGAPVGDGTPPPDGAPAPDGSGSPDVAGSEHAAPSRAARSSTRREATRAARARPDNSGNAATPARRARPQRAADPGSAPPVRPRRGVAQPEDSAATAPRRAAPGRPPRRGDRDGPGGSLPAPEG
ncbi:MAG TPA: hypothetical protein VMD59_08890, partial [Acidimicrobiales bacterium]|nr:hypothetical protein [Acidimicrobiales bacterium]